MNAPNSSDDHPQKGEVADTSKDEVFIVAPDGAAASQPVEKEGLEDVSEGALAPGGENGPDVQGFVSGVSGDMQAGSDNLERAVEDLVRHVDDLIGQQPAEAGSSPPSVVSDARHLNEPGQNSDTNKPADADHARAGERERLEQHAIMERLDEIVRLSARSAPPEDAWRKLDECHARMGLMKDPSEFNQSIANRLEDVAASLSESKIDERLQRLDSGLSKIVAFLQAPDDQEPVSLSGVKSALSTMQSRLDALHEAMPKAGFSGIDASIKSLSDRLQSPPDNGISKRFSSLERHLGGLVEAVDRLAKDQRSLEQLTLEQLASGSLKIEAKAIPDLERLSVLLERLDKRVQSETGGKNYSDIGRHIDQLSKTIQHLAEASAVFSADEVRKELASLRDEQSLAGPRSERLISVLDGIGKQLDRLPRERPATVADVKAQIEQLMGSMEKSIDDPGSRSAEKTGAYSKADAAASSGVVKKSVRRLASQNVAPDGTSQDGHGGSDGQASGVATPEVPSAESGFQSMAAENDGQTTLEEAHRPQDTVPQDAKNESGDDLNVAPSSTSDEPGDLTNNERDEIRASTARRASFGQRNALKADPAGRSDPPKDTATDIPETPKAVPNVDDAATASSKPSWIMERLSATRFLDRSKPSARSEPVLEKPSDKPGGEPAEVSEADDEPVPPTAAVRSDDDDGGSSSGSPSGSSSGTPAGGSAGPSGKHSQSSQAKIDSSTAKLAGADEDLDRAPPFGTSSFDLGLSTAMRGGASLNPDAEIEGSVDLLTLARRAARAAAEEAKRANRKPSAATPGATRIYPGAATKMLGLGSILAMTAVVGAAMIADSHLTFRFADTFTEEEPVAAISESEDGKGLPIDASFESADRTPITTGSVQSYEQWARMNATSGTTDATLPPLPAPSSGIAFAEPQLLEASSFSSRSSRQERSHGLEGFQDRLPSEEIEAGEPSAFALADLERLDAIDERDQSFFSKDAAKADPAPVGAASSIDQPDVLSDFDGDEVELRRLADSGNPKAQFELANQIANGHVLAIEDGEEITLYQNAARSGFASAQYALATLYEAGRGASRNPEMAAFWYKEAAETGHAKAMHNLAVLSAGGVDGQPDLSTAVHWFERAAQNGVHDSQFNLGILYAKGAGVEKDPAQAYKWFAIAALSGDQQAQSRRDTMAESLSQAQIASLEREIEQFGSRYSAVGSSEPFQAKSGADIDT